MHDQPTSRLSQGAARPIAHSYTAARTLAALERLASRPHSAPELADALGIVVKTARHMLQRFEAEGYAVQERSGRYRRYHLTLRLLAVSASAEANLTVLSAVKLRLAALAETTAAAVHVWVPRGARAVLIWGPIGLGGDTRRELAASVAAASRVLFTDGPISEGRESQRSSAHIPAVAVTEQGQIVAAITLGRPRTDGDILALQAAADDLSV